LTERRFGRNGGALSWNSDLLKAQLREMRDKDGSQLMDPNEGLGNAEITVELFVRRGLIPSSLKPSKSSAIRSSRTLPK
jgi:hypothetical protein